MTTPFQKDGLHTAPMAQRLASLGSERWAVHFEARRRVAAGEDIIELTIGEPDVPTPSALVETAAQAMRDGRTGYAGGRGEPGLLAAIARHYTKRSGRTVTPENVLALPGTQAALTVAMMTLVSEGDEVLLPDPYYATYEGVVRASGAQFVSVPMDAENGFHLTADYVEAAITPATKVLLLNSPHNPTGAVLTRQEITGIGAVCAKHDLWIVSDEVYESLIFHGQFASPFDQADLARRTLVTSSISKSHAAPGFRSGWMVGPEWVLNAAQGIAEALLFGNQPFIADMTEHAMGDGGEAALAMRANYMRRISLLAKIFEKSEKLTPLLPEAGMFMLVDVSATGLDGNSFAEGLLDAGVAVMPGGSFGAQAKPFIRLSLTVPDEVLVEGANRICAFAAGV
ncbi:MAG: pyridoxal phosphate-dependent aminotransferase [Pseudomonadota bacterium]